MNGSGQLSNWDSKDERNDSLASDGRVKPAVKSAVQTATYSDSGYTPSDCVTAFASVLAASPDGDIESATNSANDGGKPSSGDWSATLEAAHSLIKIRNAFLQSVLNIDMDTLPGIALMELLHRSDERLVWYVWYNDVAAVAGVSEGVLKLCTNRDHQIDTEIAMLSKLSCLNEPALMKIQRCFKPARSITAVIVTPMGKTWKELDTIADKEALVRYGAEFYRLLNRMYFECGICHCDINPNNVILVGPDNQPCLIDFGMATERFVYGCTRGYESDALLDDPSFHEAHFWDDAESLMLTLYATDIGVALYSSRHLHKHLPKQPQQNSQVKSEINREINRDSDKVRQRPPLLTTFESKVVRDVFIPRICWFDMLSIATHHDIITPPNHRPSPIS